MTGNSKKITLFLSNPCSITEKMLMTDSSWYRFVSELGVGGDTLNIVAPDLKVSSSTFSVKLKMAVTVKKLEHFFYSSFKGFYLKAIVHPISFVKGYFNAVKASDYVIFRIPTPGFTLIAVLSILLKKPLIVFISGNIREQSDSYYNSRGLMRLLLSLVLKVRVKLHSIFLKRCQHVFCVSSDVMQLYDIVPGKNIEIARTPVISLKNIDGLGVRRVKPDSSKVYKLIRVCWLQESKGLEGLIRAVHSLSKRHDVSLDIYGAAKDEDYGKRISSLITELEMDSIISIRGWASNDQLQLLYRDFDLHVMSSVSEGMPRVCLESAAKGLPQLVTPVGGVPDFFTHLHDAFISDDCSAKSLEQGVEWFIHNRELGERIAENALIGVRGSSIECFSERFNRLMELR